MAAGFLLPIKIMQIQNNRLFWNDGTPLCIVGSGGPEGFFYQPGTTQNDQIAKLATNGGNSLYTITVRSHGGDGDATQNPFIGNNPNNGVALTVLDTWAGWIQQCNTNKIVVYVILYDDSADPWNDKASSTISLAEQVYIETIVNRFAAFENVIWGYAEEADSTFTIARISAGVALIKSLTSQLVAIHQNPSLVPKSYGQDIFACQSGVFAAGVPDPATVNSQAITALNNSANKHVGMWEIQPSHGDDGETSTRQVNWAALMGNTSVMVLMWDITNTSIAELNQARIAQQFFESIPAQYLQASNVRALGSTEFVLSDQQSFVIYGRNATTGLGITGLIAGQYNLTWLDTITGQIIAETVPAIAGNNTFSKPIILGNEIALYGALMGKLNLNLTETEKVTAIEQRPRLKDDYHTLIRQLRSTKFYLETEILPELTGPSPTQNTANKLFQHIDVVIHRPTATSNIPTLTGRQATKDAAKAEHLTQAYDLGTEVQTLVNNMSLLKQQAAAALVGYNPQSPKPLNNGLLTAITNAVNEVLTSL